MTSRRTYGLRPQTGRNPRLVPGEFPISRTSNIDRYAEGNATERIPDTASLRSAPGFLQHTSFDRAASPRMSRSLSHAPEGGVTSPSSPLTSLAPEENAPPIERAESMGPLEHVTPGAESPVKVEPDPEGPWFTVGRDGRHARSPSHSSEHNVSRYRGGTAPLLDEVLSAAQRAEEGMTPAERARYHKRMRCEFDCQEQDRLACLRQLEEDAWVAEQLSKTPSPLPAPQAPVQSSPLLRNSAFPRSDEIHPDEQCRKLGHYYGEAADRRRNREVPPGHEIPETEVTSDDLEPVQAVLFDDRDLRINALEQQLQNMMMAIERLSSQQGIVSRVAPLPTVSSHDNDAHAEVVTTGVTNEANIGRKACKDKKKKKSPVQKAQASLMPSAQLEPTSFLGKILLTGGGPPSDDLSSSSSSSSGDSRHAPEDHHSYGSDGEVDENSRKNRKPRLKPVNPDKYDGREDAEAFHKYVRQMSEYLDGYRVKRTMFASTASNFLTGKAYRFFIHKVSGHEPESWQMTKFFKGLFDYCFDHNYQQKMLEKLDALEQGNRSVQEYIHEFEETIQQVGIISGADRVNRLFRGFKLGIQGDLYSIDLPTILMQCTAVAPSYLYPSCPPGAAGSAHLPAILGRIAQAPAASRVVACPRVPATKIAYPAALPVIFSLV